MDADLQHPPALVPELVAAGQQAERRPRGRHPVRGRRRRAGLAGRFRMLASGGTTLLAKALFRRRLRRGQRPDERLLRGRAAALEPTCSPLGYKILLELVVRCPLGRVAEVPYQFQHRFAGESKANFGEGLRFLRHLTVLRVGSVASSLTRLARPGRRTAPLVSMKPPRRRSNEEPT